MPEVPSNGFETGLQGEQVKLTGKKINCIYSRKSFGGVADSGPCQVKRDQTPAQPSLSRSKGPLPLSLQLPNQALLLIIPKSGQAGVV